ncbi:Hypothetical protein D9617_49g041290 [Elsinoe fawcettii]|nr:Hypothetical protein D9617_49g041290 [Elsinoe fawcettii]
MLYPIPSSSLSRIRSTQLDPSGTRTISRQPSQTRGEPKVRVTYTIPTLIFCMIASYEDPDYSAPSLGGATGVVVITLEMICDALGYDYAEVERMGPPLAGIQDGELTQDSLLHFEIHGGSTTLYSRSSRPVPEHHIGDSMLSSTTDARLGILSDSRQASYLRGGRCAPKITDTRNFEHIDQQSRSPNMNVVAFLHFVSLWKNGCDVRVLAEIDQPQDNWTACGALLSRTWEERFARFFRGADFSGDFLTLSDLCTRRGWMTIFDYNGNTVYRVNAEGRHELQVYDTPRLIILRSVAMIAHLVPVDYDLSTTFVARGRMMLPALESLLFSQSVRCILTATSGHEPTALVAKCRKSLIEASLTVFRLFRYPMNESILAYMEHLMRHDPPDYLSIALAWKKSQMHRSRGQVELSKTEVRFGNEMAEPMTGHLDLRTKYYRKRLLLSQADNEIILKNFDEARTLLEQCAVLPIRDEISPLELQLLRIYNTTHGRISQYEGKFDFALSCYLQSRQAYLSQAGERHMYSHVADIMCELGLEEAAQLELVSRFDTERMLDDHRTLDNRRILLPLAETYLKQNRISDAQRAIDTAIKLFCQLERPNITDQLGHIRAKFGQIRILVEGELWHSAAKEIDSAIAMAHGFNAFTATNYYIGLLWKYKFIVDKKSEQSGRESKVFTRLGDFDPGPRHFIPGLGTYVRADIERLAQSCGVHFGRGVF